MKYCLVQDESCHWFVIPADNKEDWEAFRNIPEDDPQAWDVPDFAISIDGVEFITFDNPCEHGKEIA